MLRPLFRTAVALLSRAFLWMTLSAVIVLGAMRYGPTLLLPVLPAEIRPSPSDTAKMSPQKIIDGLKQIRGALE